MGDVRIATNVTKADGSRAVGTDARAGAGSRRAVQGTAESYRGAAEILGQRYFVAYDPIRDKGGATIGALFVGQLEAETHAEIASIQVWAFSSRGRHFAPASAPRRSASSVGCFAPLARLRAAMTTISDGDLAASIEGVERGDDIGRMAAAVEVFRLNAIERARAEAEARLSERPQWLIERRRPRNARSSPKRRRPPSSDRRRHKAPRRQRPFPSHSDAAS